MSLFAELKRRNVFRVGIAYVIATWLILQIVDVVIPLLTLPDWVGRFVFLLLAVGFIPALIFAWGFELTPDGLKRESEVDRSTSIAPQTGRKLDFVIIGVMAVALAWFAWDKFGSDQQGAATPELATQAVKETPQTTTIEQSVAVLPFVAMSSGPDDEYFADGLTEEILNSLAQLPQLLVTARTSAFHFKGQDLPPIQEIAKTLGVAHIVEGSVRKSGDRLRVTAQLIRADDGFHLWSENYDSSSADTIDVQEDIAEQIATAMNIVLDANSRAAMKQVGLRDVEAFIALQKGLDWHARAHGEIDQIIGLRQANEFFEEVIRRAPGFSPAYTLHSDLFIHVMNNSVTQQAIPGVTEEDITNSLPLAVADLQAAANSARTPEELHAAILDLAYVSGNWRGITGRLEQTLAEQGCNDGVWTGPFANVFGYAAQYRQRAEETRRCDPLVSTNWFTEARSALWAGDTEGALEIARTGSDTAPGLWLNLVLIRSLIANGLFEEASQEINNSIVLSSVANTLHAMNAAAQGNRDQYEAHLNAYLADPNASGFWTVINQAWGGNRAAANQLAATMDANPLGLVPMQLITYWCICGAPWDLEATPNFAAKLAEGNLPWPPPSPIKIPLKDW